MKKTVLACLASACLMSAAIATPAGLAARLRQGGYVLVMRHAHAPDAPPALQQADPANRERERQLDQVGRGQAAAMGAGLRRLGVPVGAIFSSPTFRALETARLLAVGAATPVPQLGDQGRSMQRITGPGPSRWLQQKVAEMPPAGRNVLVITQMPNIADAFPAAGKLGDGEALIFRPDGHGAARLVAHMPVGDWAAMPR